MGIFIPSRVKPNYCGSCFLCAWVDYLGELKCLADDHLIDNAFKPQNCPLIEIDDEIFKAAHPIAFQRSQRVESVESVEEEMGFDKTKAYIQKDCPKYTDSYCTGRNCRKCKYEEELLRRLKRVEYLKRERSE